MSQIRDNGHVRVKLLRHALQTFVSKIQCQSDYEKLVSETNIKERHVVYVWPSNYSVCVWHVVCVLRRKRERDMHVTQWDYNTTGAGLTVSP